MRHRRIIVCTIVLFAILGTLAVSYRPSSAQQFFRRDPIQDVLDLLAEIKQEVTVLGSGVASIEAELTDPQHGLVEIKSEVAAIEEKVGRTARVAIIEGAFETLPGTTTAFNLDVAGSLPFLKIKRYTLTIYAVPLVGATPGLDSIEVFNGVLDGETAFSNTPIIRVDPTVDSTVVVPPYVGTNSFIRVTRDLDGKGAANVRVNAYVELEQ